MAMENNPRIGGSVMFEKREIWAVAIKMQGGFWELGGNEVESVDKFFNSLIINDATDVADALGSRINFSILRLLVLYAIFDNDEIREFFWRDKLGDVIKLVIANGGDFIGVFGEFQDEFADGVFILFVDVFPDD